MVEADDIRAEYRRKFLDADYSASQDLDKAIMALAGGGLGISLTLAKDITDPTMSSMLPWLIATWVFLAGSLVAVVLSYVASQVAVRLALNELSGEASPKQGVRATFWRVATSILNYSAVLLLVVGIGTLVYFAASGTGRAVKMTQAETSNRDKTKPPPIKIERGWSPPKAPPAQPPVKVPATPTPKERPTKK